MVLTPGKKMGAKVMTSTNSLERNENANEDSNEAQHKGVASILEVRHYRATLSCSWTLYENSCLECIQRGSFLRHE